MELFQCIEQRKSCRAFIQKEVDHDIIVKILKAANRSPSYRNSQPWEVFVVRGKKKEALAEKLLDAAATGISPTPDIPAPQEWPDAHDKRMKEHFQMRFKDTGIDPGNETRMREVLSMNLKFYDAPCVIFIGMDKSLTTWSIFDLGIFVQSILLGLEAEGLGGCPQASPTRYADIIRNELGIPGMFSIILAISLGYPDPDSPANKYQSKRKDINDFVRWFDI